jgi:hypothetical protein
MKSRTIIVTVTSLVMVLMASSCDNNFNSQESQIDYHRETADLPVVKINTGGRLITSKEVWLKDAAYTISIKNESPGGGYYQY